MKFNILLYFNDSDMSTAWAYSFFCFGTFPLNPPFAPPQFPVNSTSQAQDKTRDNQSIRSEDSTDVFWALSPSWSHPTLRGREVVEKLARWLRSCKLKVGREWLIASTDLDLLPAGDRDGKSSRRWQKRCGHAHWWRTHPPDEGGRVTQSSLFSGTLHTGSLSRILLLISTDVYLIRRATPAKS